MSKLDARRGVTLGDMASVRKEIGLDVAPDDAWAALRDWGALHVRLAPGFVVDTRLDGEDRLVTFFSGAVVRERLVDRDDLARRLAWSIVDGPYLHHNGVAQVLPDGAGGCRFVWTADFLPHEAAERIAAMMERGIEAIGRTLGQTPGP